MSTWTQRDRPQLPSLARAFPVRLVLGHICGQLCASHAPWADPARPRDTICRISISLVLFKNNQQEEMSLTCIRAPVLLETPLSQRHFMLQHGRQKKGRADISNAELPVGDSCRRMWRWEKRARRLIWRSTEQLERGESAAEHFKVSLSVVIIKCCIQKPE